LTKTQREKKTAIFAVKYKQIQVYIVELDFMIYHHFRTLKRIIKITIGGL